ncbi:50S ribosomal protein L18a [Candidatus Micrarchaeota archaeon]|nr:50S ribosomal protein L18a [Candidatus Micrarchaeota archaeon]
MKFVVKGEMDLGSESRKFSKEVEAASESSARNLVLKTLGGQHGLKAQKIKISEVKKGGLNE